MEKIKLFITTHVYTIVIVSSVLTLLSLGYCYFKHKK